MSRNSEFLNLSVSQLDDCENTLKKISMSCCMPGRSSLMNATFDLITEARYEIQQVVKGVESLPSCCEVLGKIGGLVGMLHVTCCTPTREVKYQHILQQLNAAHENLNKAMGFSH